MCLSIVAGLVWIIVQGPADTELMGKVVCGYQGWFRAEGDGTGLGWVHYAEGGEFAPGRCTIDLWPDVRELPETDRFATPFLHPDGSRAEVFSSARPGTVRIHFQWMRDYGIDGVFLQRFVVSTRDRRLRASLDTVLAACRESAGETGRKWALMYDLSGLRPGEAQEVIDDWTHLHKNGHFAEARREKSYLTHKGRPLVGLWGLGFSDRPPMLDEWRRILAFLRDDPEFGGNAILLGVPTFWRSLNRDAIADPALHEIMASADLISPWTVGRYRSPDEARKYVDETLKSDLAWSREHGLGLVPVVFPGFSWHNLQKVRGRTARLAEIPRRGGAFLQAQIDVDLEAGARVLYVAMFDELDEGTAIFKVRQDPPVGESPFVSEPSVPPDHYLRLTGEAARRLHRLVGEDRGQGVEVSAKEDRRR